MEHISFWINSLKMGQKLNISEQQQQNKVTFMKKLRAD
jgi:hypothetical protein